MTLERDTAISVDRLGPADRLETFGFLDRDPVMNVYLLALTLRDGLAHARDEFWGARRDGELVGLIHLGGQTGSDACPSAAMRRRSRCWRGSRSTACRTCRVASR